MHTTTISLSAHQLPFVVSPTTVSRAVAARFSRETATETGFSFVRSCSLASHFERMAKVHRNEQPRTILNSREQNKNTGQRFDSLRRHLPLYLYCEPILKAFHFALSLEIQFPPIHGGNFAGTKLPPNSKSTIV